MDTYRFNPPLHPSLRHIVPNIGVVTPEEENAVVDRLYVTKTTGVKPPVRLGRIVAAPITPVITQGGSEFRYGFRFLYNPTTVSGGQNVGSNQIPDPSSTIATIIQDGLETIQFEVLLNRSPDLEVGVKPSDYLPAIAKEAFENVRKYGTHYDIEYLYRVCNGLQNTRSRSGTGDIGILLPTPAELILGPFRSRGAVVAIEMQDKIFSPEMVPIISTAKITFSRFFTMAPKSDVSAPPTGSSIYGVNNSVMNMALNTIASDAWGGAGDAVSLLGDGFFGLFAGFGDFGKKIQDALDQTSKPPEKVDEDDPPEKGGSTPPPAGSSPAPTPGPAPIGNPNKAPIPGYKVTTEYLKKGNWSGGYHQGQDYAAPAGTQVICTRAGTVIHAGAGGSQGGWAGSHYVMVESRDPDGTVFTHIYAHMRATDVAKGNTVVAGSPIGKVNNEGRSFGNHLHYEEQVKGKHRQPRYSNIDCR